MIKSERLEAIKELKKDFKAADESIYMLSELYRLLDADYIPYEMDLYEVNMIINSKSMLNGWTSHDEPNKYYSFYIELIKAVNDKVVSEWVRIEHDKKDLLIKLHEILK